MAMLFNSTSWAIQDRIEDGPPVLLMQPWAYNLSAAILAVIWVTGLLLNSCVIVIMIRSSKQHSWSPMNIILMNLVCSDLTVAALGTPLTFASAVARHWAFGRGMCVAYGFFMATLGIGSITTLTVLAFERRMLISRLHPSGGMRAPAQFTGSFLVIAGIWTYALMLTVPPLFGWGIYRSEAADISCSVNWESRSANSTSYILFLFITGLAVPVAVILYSYCGIVYIVKKSASRVGHRRIDASAEAKVTRMVFLMITAFLVAWGPYAVMALLEQFGPEDLISPALAVAPSLLAKSSICYNPIIYVAMNSQFSSQWRSASSAFVSTKTGQSAVYEIEMQSSRRPGDILSRINTAATCQP